MSTLAVPQFAVADLWAALKNLALRLVANPALLDKVKAAWDACLVAYEALFGTPAPGAVAYETLVDEWLAEAAPGKLFDGKILKFISGISAFLDTHPQLVAFFLQLIAMIPKETETV